ncbi:hypothetical protein B0H16DRAFT_1641095 [Mycena metata]|uniref:Uncharacterized protein n=1 Tax=Mycena metata TaxID=1033252 RepID=A0AAD7GM91_9AGAR|nr:hypothetical protein B0H16DRAFT_1641095 [Mycena metata]
MVWTGLQREWGGRRNKCGSPLAVERLEAARRAHRRKTGSSAAIRALLDVRLGDVPRERMRRGLERRAVEKRGRRICAAATTVVVVTVSRTGLCTHTRTTQPHTIPPIEPPERNPARGVLAVSVSPRVPKGEWHGGCRSTRVGPFFVRNLRVSFVA